MKIRKITSMIAGLSFALMVLTSVILYIAPQGRVAYWADWHLWGMTKTDWGNIHINVGLLFLIALFLHIYFNWKPLMAYLKNKARKIKVFTPEFNTALIITAVFTVGTYFLVPPFSWMMTLNDFFKDAGAEKYGEPPYGHAELSSLETFTKKMNIDLTKSMELLTKAGYMIDSGNVSLVSIGQQFNISPQKIYQLIKPAQLINSTQKAESKSSKSLPDSPPPGTGNLTLADFCAQFDLNMKLLVRELKKQGIVAAKEFTLKQIAADNNISPADVYEAIKVMENDNS